MVGLSSENRDPSRVADFYNGKSVFLTGASGFVGTVLLEILLRCFPGIESIYILLRAKKNVQPEVRKQKIFNKKIFEKIKDKSPELLDKVHVLPGDNSLPNLGLSEDDIQLLVEKVSIVFHCAAILNFTKPLKFILLHNVLGLESIIELCRKFRNFEVLVYTSTAYSNCNHIKSTLREEVIRLPFRGEKFLDALKNDDDEKLEEMYAHCKPDWPNTYTFSKCLAENLIADTASDLPVAIIRPSIVLSTWKHPMPGYVEDHSGIAALSVGVGKGFVKVLHADPNNKLNMVPADIAGNAHVLAAWSIATKKCKSPLIVNCTATEKLDIKLSEYTETLTELSLKFPLPQSFEEFSGLKIVPYRYLYYIVAAYYHYVPAIALDGILKVLGKKPRVYSMYRFFDTVMSSLKFFMFHHFELERKNLEYLDKLIHPEERNNLYLDFREASFSELCAKIPEVAPFYDWKIDRKSPEERQKVKFRRHLIIKGIQMMFIVILCLIIYWVFCLI